MLNFTAHGRREACVRVTFNVSYFNKRPDSIGNIHVGPTNGVAHAWQDESFMDIYTAPLSRSRLKITNKFYHSVPGFIDSSLTVILLLPGPN